MAPASTGYMSTYILVEQEDWFEDEIRFIRRLLRPGERAIDIGANLGVYSAAMARAVGPAGVVWSFEPTAETASCFAATLAQNRFEHVQLVQGAVGDRDGTMRLAAHPNAEVNYLTTDRALPGEDVRVATLDRYAAEFGCRNIDLVKIDVEDHEARVLAGAGKFLATESPLVMVEISITATGKAALKAEMSRLSFPSFRYLPGLDALVPFDFARSQVPAYMINLFLCRPERASALVARGLAVMPPLPGCGPAPVATWQDWLARRPYASAMPASNARAAGRIATSDLYLQALADYAAAHVPGEELAIRWQLLMAAARRMTELVTAQPSVARRCSFARIAWEAGERRIAVETLYSLIGQLDTGEAPSEPFLPPCPRYDAIDPGDDYAAWLRAAVIEQYEKLRLFSSYFSKGESIDLLRSLATNSFIAPEIERRLLLTTRRRDGGRKSAPSPRLSVMSPMNLNPSIWRGETSLAFA